MGEAWTYITPDAKKAKKMARKDVFVNSSSLPARCPPRARLSRN